ncbi:cyclin-O isoform 2-T2 [Spinachia spinachia]
MVSSDKGERGSEAVNKRRRAEGASPPTEAHATLRRPQSARHRKQTLVSKLSDSGFEEDLGSTPTCSPARGDVSPLRSDERPSGRVSNWYLQYGDVGFQIQRDNEALFYSCKSLAHQPQVTAEARCELVSWLIPVHKHFRLSFECCCLAVNIVDRFMAATPLAADCFQLLGVTALLLASKQVEVGSPRIGHLLELCCNAFTEQQLCNLECLVLLRLNFRLSAPTLAFFLDYYANSAEAAPLKGDTPCSSTSAPTNPDARRPGRCGSVARKLCELTLADYAFNQYPPSLTARCALTVAGELLEREQPGSPRPERRDVGAADPLEAKEHLSLLSEGGCDPGAAHKCTHDLRLLVSLNQEALEGMCTV